MFEGYKYIYRFNAMHSLNINKSLPHSHTFEIALYIVPDKMKNVSDYYEYEKIVNDYFEKFKGKLLNETTLFKNKIPTIENMGDIFYIDLKRELKKQLFKLIQFEISEIPTRVYILSERII